MKEIIKMQLIDVLNNIDFNTFESATGCVGDLQYTLTLRGKQNIPATMHGDWRDYVIRNCMVLNTNRINSGLDSIDMFMTFSVQGVVYGMEIVISEAPKPLAITESIKLDDVDIAIDAVVNNGKRRTRGPNKPKQVV